MASISVVAAALMILTGCASTAAVPSTSSESAASSNVPGTPGDGTTPYPSCKDDVNEQRAIVATGASISGVPATGGANCTVDFTYGSPSTNFAGLAELLHFELPWSEAMSDAKYAGGVGAQISQDPVTA